MNWKFWKKKSPKQEAQKLRSGFDAFVDMAVQAKAEADAARWRALPDQRKAARIEYRLLAGLRAGRILEWPEDNYRDYLRVAQRQSNPMAINWQNVFLQSMAGKSTSPTPDPLQGKT